MQDYTNMLLSWSQFCKEPLSERNFTFWEWFFAVMKVRRSKVFLTILIVNSKAVGVCTATAKKKENKKIINK